MKNFKSVAPALLIIMSFMNTIHGSTTQKPVITVDRPTLFALLEKQDNNITISGEEILSQIRILSDKIPFESGNATEQTIKICSTLQGLVNLFCNEQYCRTNIAASFTPKINKETANNYLTVFQKYSESQKPEDFAQCFNLILNGYSNDRQRITLLENDLWRSIQVAGFNPCELDIEKSLDKKSKKICA